MMHRMRDIVKRDGIGGRGFLPAVLFMLTVFLIASSVLGSSKAYAAVAKNTAQTDTNLEVTCGFGDTAKGDRYLPVRISLEYKGTESFDGTFEILTTASSREVYRFDYPVSIHAGENFKTVYYIPLGVKGDQLFVTLRSGEGKEIVKKRVKLNISSDASETLIGVLSDSPDTVSYLDRVGIRYGAIRTRIVNLETKSIPEDLRGLDQLDLIVVSDYDFDRLTKQQQNCILRWVEEGGTILFGGGAGHRENMGRLASELLESPSAVPVLQNVNLGTEYSQNGPQESVIDLLCVDPSMIKGSDLMPGDVYPLLSLVHRNKGRIVTAGFHLADIGSFCREHPGFSEKLLIRMWGDSQVEELAQADYYGFSSSYFSAQGLINTGNVDRLPNIIVYTVIMVLYVLLIGPGLYLFLKKKAVQRYYIGTVAVCAMLFTVIIYGVGTKTRFKDPFFTYATILDASKEQTREQIFINVRSPFNKPYTVKLMPEYEVRPITKSYYYDSITATEFTGTESWNTTLYRESAGTQIIIRDTAAFTPKMFSLNRESGTVDINIQGELRFFDGQISGTVVNDSDSKLENAVILLYGRAVLLGDMEPGQEIVLDGMELLTYPLNYTYAFAQTATGAAQYEKADISDSAYMLAQERTRLMSFYMDENMTDYSQSARFVAFSPERNEKKFLIEKNYITEGITLVTAALDVKMEQDGLFYRSALEQTPNMISGNYQARYNSMYTGEPAEPAVVEYSLGSDLEIQSLVFEPLSSVFLSNPQYPYLAAFQGKMYFYNYDTGQNDLMEPEKKYFDAWELEPYLSPSNTITVKYVNEAVSEYGWDKILPLIYVTGREK